MSTIVLYVGGIATYWGILWLMWDKYSSAVGWLLGIGIVCLLAGMAMS